MKSALVLATVCLLMSSPVNLTAQKVTIVPSEPGCSTCEIRFLPIATLGGVDGPGRVGRNSVVHRGPRGRYFEASPQVPGRILVFGPDGTYETALGSMGSKPGEYVFVRHISSFGDNLHVFDTRQLRWTMLGKDLEVERTSPFLGDILYVAMLSDTTAITSQVIRTQDRIGLPLHIWSANGKILQSFGGDEGYRPGLPFLGSHPIAVTDHSSVWIADRTRFELEEWEIGGAQISQLSREADWFRPHNRGLIRDRETPPLPILWDIQLDPKGLLWVLVSVPDESWYEGLEAGQSPHPEVLRINDYRGFLDTIIEVIDPKTGELLVSERSDLFFQRFIGSGYVDSYREEADGTPFIDVWRLQLHSATQNQREEER